MEFDLVFEGGGAKGLAFVGALTAFERRGHTTRRVIGTSAGSILAALLAAGFNAAESLAAISERLPDGRPRFAGFLQTPVIEDNPLLSAGARSWLNTELNNPDVGGHRVVDGGLLSNFPIKLLVSSDEHIDEIMGKDTAAQNVIGFLIDESLPVPGAGEPPPDNATFPALLDRLDVLQTMIWRIRGLADTVLSARDKFINEKDQRLVCRLPALGYGSLEFDMTNERMLAIRRAGEAAADNYFEGRQEGYSGGVADLRSVTV
jgi:predicted acylesterase/phospholipase RssA